MKRLLILGAGTAGTMVLNKLARRLDPAEWTLTVVDRDETHLYQPGLLFIPFGIYDAADVQRPKRDFFPPGVEAIFDEVVHIDPGAHTVTLADGGDMPYDVLVIATGADVRPDETPGLLGEGWRRDAFDFYTLDGAVALAERLRTWTGGDLVIALAESVFKCPVAPLEFAFLADAFFTERDMRERVRIRYVTPLSGAFTKPKATAMLSALLEEKGIEVVPDFYIEHVDPERRVLVSYDEMEIPYDVLVAVPVNMGTAAIEESGMGDDDGLGFVPTDRHSLAARDHADVFVIGDATNVPTSKAGSVAHFEADVVVENILAHIGGREPEAVFDGHANCFIETGHGRAALIDFNYDVEPLPGAFPIPGLGPLKLLRETRLNHLGKLGFRWAYWHLLLPGRPLPVPSAMSMRGKREA